MNKKYLLTAVVSATLALSACNSEEEATGEKVTSLRELSGVYNWSETDDDGEVNEWYLSIDSEGNVSDSDYDGDAMGNGVNCYYTDNDWDQIAHVSDNEFESENNGTFTVLENEGVYTFSFEEGYTEELEKTALLEETLTSEDVDCDET